MALYAVEGVYRDGKVELTETPAGVEEARVMVVFLPASSAGATETPPAGSEAARRAAAERLLTRMRKGYHLGGGRPYTKREELYDRLERDR
jgi:hypothetical protein